jgi:hypothetical protein
MKRNQILAITFCSLACLGYPNRSANAGWFGPSNYEECVLEKMKGQSRYMFNAAMRACDDKFPCPKGETRAWDNQTCIDEELYTQFLIQQTRHAVPGMAAGPGRT